MSYTHLHLPIQTLCPEQYGNIAASLRQANGVNCINYMFKGFYCSNINNIVRHLYYYKQTSLTKHLNLYHTYLKNGHIYT